MTSSDTTANSSSVHIGDAGIPIRNLWYMLLYSWGEVPFERPGSLEEIEAAPTLDALLAFMLAKLLQQRLRTGLGRDYQNGERMLRRIRGRILFSESLKHLVFERGQVFCDFEDFNLNVPKNQIVLSTLLRLVPTGQFGPRNSQTEALRHSLRSLVRQLAGIDFVELTPGVIQRQQLGRNDRDYRLMLSICEFILLRQMPKGSNGTRRVPSINKSALVMHNIYERFVANFYRIHLDNWTVTPQKLLHWYERSSSRFLPSMHPDLFMQDNNSGRIVFLDTKFSDSLKTGRWGVERFDSAHLYQMYTYVKTQEHLSDSHREASGILLYPTTRQEGMSEKVALRDIIIRVETVDLAAPWQQIERKLLDIILNGR